MITVGKMANLKTDLQVRWVERFVSVICKTLVQLQQLNVEVISELYKSTVNNEPNPQEHTNKVLEESVKSFLTDLLKQTPLNSIAENEEVPVSRTENVMSVNVSALSPNQSNEHAYPALSTVKQRVSLEKSLIHEATKKKNQFENTNNFSPRDHETSEELFPSSPVLYSKSNSSIRFGRSRLKDPVNELLSSFIRSKDVAQNSLANPSESVEDSIPVYGALVEVETQSENSYKSNEEQSETSGIDRTSSEASSSPRSTSPLCEWVSSFPTSYGLTPHFCPISESPFPRNNSKRKKFIQMRRKQRNMIAAKIRRNAKAYRENTISVQLPFTQANPTESVSVLGNSSENVSQTSPHDDNLNDVFIEQSIETGVNNSSEAGQENRTPEPEDSQGLQNNSYSMSLQLGNTSETRKEKDIQDTSTTKELEPEFDIRATVTGSGRIMLQRTPRKKDSIIQTSVEVVGSQNEPGNSSESLHLDIDNTEPSVLLLLDTPKRRSSSSVEDVLQVEANLTENITEIDNVDSTAASQDMQYSSSIILQLESQRDICAEKIASQDVQSVFPAEKSQLESENNPPEEPVPPAASEDTLSSSSFAKNASSSDSRAESDEEAQSTSDRQDAQSSSSFEELKLEIDDDSLEGNENETDVPESLTQNPERTVPGHVQFARPEEECGSKTAKRTRAGEDDDDDHENTHLVCDSDSVKRQRSSSVPVPTHSEGGNPQQTADCESTTHEEGTGDSALCNPFRMEQSASHERDSIPNETTDFVHSTLQMTRYCIPPQDVENRSDEVERTKVDLWVLLNPISIEDINAFKCNESGQFSSNSVEEDHYRREKDVSSSIDVLENIPLFQRISRPRRATRRDVNYWEEKSAANSIKNALKRKKMRI